MDRWVGAGHRSESGNGAPDSEDLPSPSCPREMFSSLYLLDPLCEASLIPDKPNHLVRLAPTYDEWA